MSETAASQAPRRGILLMFLAGVLLALGVFLVVLASRQATDVDVAATRVASGCVSMVELPASGRYLVSVENSGPSLSAEQACREIPAGLRSGDLESVRMLSPTGSMAEIPVASSTSRIVAGGQRASLGVVEVDVAGQYEIEVVGAGDVVVTIGADPSGVRTRGWWWGIGCLIAAVACLLVVRPRSRQRGVATETNQWSAPLAKDRLG